MTTRMNESKMKFSNEISDVDLEFDNFMAELNSFKDKNYCPEINKVLTNVIEKLTRAEQDLSSTFEIVLAKAEAARKELDAVRRASVSESPGISISSTNTDSCQESLPPPIAKLKTFYSALEKEAYARSVKTPTVVAEIANRECIDKNESALDSQDFTVWELFTSWYLPVLAVWIRRSMFGPFNVVRSIILSHFLRVLFTTTNIDTASWSNLDNFIPLWAQQYLLFLNMNSNKTSKTHAWPPPALIVLATLTIVALIVHPDGMTWILLRKIRDAVITLIHSSTSCWSLVVKDYGIISTLAALATFAVLAFLGIIMHKTLSPRSSGKQKKVTAEKKKKKRKGHHTRRGRIKPSPRKFSEQQQNQDKGPHPTRLEFNLKIDDENRISHVNNDNSIDALTCIHSSPASSDVYLQEQSNGNEIHSIDENQSTASAQSVAEGHPTAETSASLLMISPTGTDCYKDQVKERARILSVSTVDTTVFCDDHSCDSTSVLSTPSTITLRSTESKSRKNMNRVRGSRNNRTSNIRRGGNYSNSRDLANVNDHPGNSNRKNANQMKKAGPSRWDALKPSHPTPTRHTTGRRSNQNQPRRQGQGHGQGNAGYSERRGLSNQFASARRTPKSSIPASLPPYSPPRLTPVNNVPPPASPVAQSLFSCEVGDSQISTSLLFPTYEDSSNMKRPWSKPSQPPAGSNHLPQLNISPTLSANGQSSNTWISKLNAYTSKDVINTDTNIGNGMKWGSCNESSWIEQEQNHPLDTCIPIRKPPGLFVPNNVQPSSKIISAPNNTQNPSEFHVHASSHYASLAVPSNLATEATATTQSLSSMPFSFPSLFPICAGTSIGNISAEGGFDDRSSFVTLPPFAEGNPLCVFPEDTDDRRIEAELQELGGQMIGSVLDY